MFVCSIGTRVDPKVMSLGMKNDQLKVNFDLFLNLISLGRKATHPFLHRVLNTFSVKTFVAGLLLTFQDRFILLAVIIVISTKLFYSKLRLDEYQWRSIFHSGMRGSVCTARSDEKFRHFV